jgi:hypothetical protein
LATGSTWCSVIVRREGDPLLAIERFQLAHQLLVLVQLRERVLERLTGGREHREALVQLLQPLLTAL